jgi:hypothetical protein
MVIIDQMMFQLVEDFPGNALDNIRINDIVVYSMINNDEPVVAAGQGRVI